MRSMYGIVKASKTKRVAWVSIIGNMQKRAVKGTLDNKTSNPMQNNRGPVIWPTKEKSERWLGIFARTTNTKEKVKVEMQHRNHEKRMKSQNEKPETPDAMQDANARSMTRPNARVCSDLCDAFMFVSEADQ